MGTKTKLSFYKHILLIFLKSLTFISCSTSPKIIFYRVDAKSDFLSSYTKEVETVIVSQKTFYCVDSDICSRGSTKYFKRFEDASAYAEEVAAESCGTTTVNKIGSRIERSTEIEDGDLKCSDTGYEWVCLGTGKKKNHNMASKWKCGNVKRIATPSNNEWRNDLTESDLINN